MCTAKKEQTPHANKKYSVWNDHVPVENSTANRTPGTICCEVDQTPVVYQLDFFLV